MCTFRGEVFKAVNLYGFSEIHIGNEIYDILPKTLLKYKNCSNAKEYIESVECFAQQVLINKTIPNEDYFKLKKRGR